MKYSAKELHVAYSKTQNTFRSGLANICGVLGCFNERYLTLYCTH